MTIAYLVDTNVLVYRYDTADHRKRQRARDVLERIRSAGNGALSTQVLGEFYHVATCRIASPLSPAQAEQSVARFLRSWVVYGISGWTVGEAAQASGRYQMSYWDGLIWATAKLNRVPTVLSEDFQHGRLLEGVRFINPFAPDFDLEPLAR
ncbi:MAG: PIN domain-containing protein [Chloroflexi bacterium]|nr:PIN domain-containing protein [Chloroflexota bacterium]